MSKDIIKSLKYVIKVLGKERVAKAFEDMTADELLDIIMHDKPICKNKELSEKRRAAANARWKKYRAGKNN